MKRSIFALTLLMGFCQSGYASNLSYDDVQLCTNAYNHLWFTFETVKSEHRNNPTAQTAAFQAEFPKVVEQNIHFGVLKLPIPPNYNTTIDLVVDGVANLIATAVSIGNFGEHHVATPFSVKLTSIMPLKRVYSMTTRDVDYTNEPEPNAGCTVYLSQKDVVCSVTTGVGGKKAKLSSLVDNVVTSYRIPGPQCPIWNAAPVTSYVD